MPELLNTVLASLVAVVNGIGYTILAITVAKFVVRYVAFEIQGLRGSQCTRRLGDIRLELGGRIVLAIDFMVIADVIHSGLVQTRDSLITLALFVLVRSVLAYFIGLVSDDAFSSALIDFADDGEINFAYNVDDITTAVPEPSSVGLVALGLAVLGSAARRPRQGFPRDHREGVHHA